MALDAGSNLVSGNFIGTNSLGAVAIPNAVDGILITSDHNTVGGLVSGARNLIGGNDNDGIEVDGSGANYNTISGNFLGTNAAGTTYLNFSNAGQSIDVEIHGGASNNLVGGTVAGARNVIGNELGYGTAGIELEDLGTNANLIQGNYIGLNASNTGVVGNVYGILEISATNTTIGGTSAAARNVITGNEYGADLIADTPVFEGNYVGTDANGVGGAVPGNEYVGLNVSSSPATIGGLTATPGTGAGNLISGNGTQGVVFFAAPAAIFEGNLVGLGANGTSKVANGGDGILLWDQTTGMTIGGTAAGARNVISGNGGNGITFDGATYQPDLGDAVQGNYIGTDISGTMALGNSLDGIAILQSHNITIGGSAIGAGNVISGNSGDGIQITSSSAGNLVAGNVIGLNYLATTPLANGGVGVFIASSGNTVGGIVAAARNVITRNAADNIEIDGNGATLNLVEGNFLGTDGTGDGGAFSGPGPALMS